MDAVSNQMAYGKLRNFKLNESGLKEQTRIEPKWTMNTEQKALAINLDAGRFGTFAEIGAGQEVVRWFFHAGHASATVAKSISAYDTAVSDDDAARPDITSAMNVWNSMLRVSSTTFCSRRLDAAARRKDRLLRVRRYRGHPYADR